MRKKDWDLNEGKEFKFNSEEPFSYNEGCETLGYVPEGKDLEFIFSRSL